MLENLGDEINIDRVIKCCKTKTLPNLQCVKKYLEIAQILNL